MAPPEALWEGVGGKCCVRLKMKYYLYDVISPPAARNTTPNLQKLPLDKRQK
jgi:hypothetical protein